MFCCTSACCKQGEPEVILATKTIKNKKKVDTSELSLSLRSYFTDVNSVTKITQVFNYLDYEK